MKFISLFSGIGGFDLGFERAGMECVAQVEIDDFCNKVLAKHWPDVPRFKDVKNVGRENLPTADLICGGFPCQPHSYAGKRRGKADDRNLWPEYFRVVDELRPRFVVGENVPGLITTMLDEILSDLESIGYTCQAFIVPACAFNAPHKRDRVWVIADSHGNNDRGRGGQIRETNSVQGFDWQAVGTWEFGGTGQDVTNPNGSTQSEEDNEWAKHELEGGEIRNIPASVHRAESNAAHSNSTRLQGSADAGSIGGIRTVNEQYIGGYAGWNENWLEVATRLCRVDDGIPRRVDRLRSLGNAVVPQVAEWIGRRIMESA